MTMTADDDIVLREAGGYSPSSAYVTPMDEPDDEDDLLGVLSELREVVRLPDVTYQIPGRPGWEITLRTDLSDEEFKRVRKSATDQKKFAMLQRTQRDTDEATDQVKMGKILIATHAVALIRKGVVMTSPTTGENLTFSSVDLHEALGTPNSPQDAVVAVFGGPGVSDGAITSVSRSLLQRTGWMDSAEEREDPTLAP